MRIQTHFPPAGSPAPPRPDCPGTGRRRSIRRRGTHPTRCRRGPVGGNRLRGYRALLRVRPVGTYSGRRVPRARHHRVDQGRAVARPHARPILRPSAGPSRCRCSTTPTTASCGPSTTACDAWAATASTSCISTIGDDPRRRQCAPIRPARRRPARRAGAPARRRPHPGHGLGVNEVELYWNCWTTPNGTSSFWRDATLCWSRPRWTPCCRAVLPRARESSAAGRSIRASWWGAIPGTTPQLLPTSSQACRYAARRGAEQCVPLPAMALQFPLGDPW